MFGGFKRYRAVVNAMNAKITFEDLDTQTRTSIDMGAKALYGSGGRTNDPTSIDAPALSRASDSLDRFTEFQKFTLYSMAMEQALLPPALSGESWDPPKNPFVLRIKERDITKAKDYFRKNHGSEIEFDAGI